MGIELVTKMGVHVPEFVDTDVAMRTTIYHESALNARITMDNNQVKLSLPAPQGSTQLFSVRYRKQTPLDSPPITYM